MLKNRQLLKLKGSHQKSINQNTPLVLFDSPGHPLDPDAPDPLNFFFSH